MNVLQVIEQREVLGKQLTMYGDFENPLFLAKEVAEWIDYDLSSINKMLNNVDEDEKVRSIVPTLGGNQEAWFLTEDGLYEVLMQSRKPIAKQFKREVKKILKSIRRHEAYMTPKKIEEVLANPDTIIELAMRLKEEQNKNKQLKTEVAQKSQLIAEMNPKAGYYDLVLQSPDLVSVTKIAKDYGKSARWLNHYLCQKKIQYKCGNIWILYQKYAEQGYTSSKTHIVTDNKGVQHSKMNTHWTQKGRLFLYDLLKEDGILPVIEKESKEQVS